MEKHKQLELMQAIRRICGRAVAEGKTHVRPATMRKMDAQIRRLRKLADHASLPQHCLNFFPLPQGHGSLRPTLGASRRTEAGESH
jgi:hypothetical protein